MPSNFPVVYFGHSRNYHIGKRETKSNGRLCKSVRTENGIDPLRIHHNAWYSNLIHHHSRYWSCRTGILCCRRGSENVKVPINFLLLQYKFNKLTTHYPTLPSIPYVSWFQLNRELELLSSWGYVLALISWSLNLSICWACQIFWVSLRNYLGNNSILYFGPRIPAVVDWTQHKLQRHIFTEKSLLSMLFVIKLCRIRWSKMSMVHFTSITNRGAIVVIFLSPVMKSVILIVSKAGAGH